MLRRVPGVTRRDKIIIESLHSPCNVVPASIHVENISLRRFAHVLRMNENEPAMRAITRYSSKKSSEGRQSNFWTIAFVISDEYKVVFNKRIKKTKLRS